MADYLTSSGVITSALNVPIPFLDSNPCRKGYVVHQNGSGIFALRGIVNCPNACVARYDVAFTGNIAIPENGAITPIAVAIVLSGEQQQGSRAIYTPAAVDEYGNVTARATVDIPRGGFYTLSVEPVNGIVDDPVVTPTPLINIVDGSLKINRIA